MANLRAWYDGLVARSRLPLIAGGAAAAVAASPDTARADLYGPVIRAPGLEEIAARYGKTFAIKWPLAAGAATIGALSSFTKGAEAAVGLDDESVRQAALTAAKQPGGYSTIGALNEWIGQQLEGINKLPETVDEIATQVAAHPIETVRSFVQAIRNNPAGALGFTSAALIPLRKPAFINNKRIPALLSWPAAVAKTSPTYEDFAARLAAPATRLHERLASARFGESVGKVKEFIDNPDLLATIHPAVLDMPVVAKGTRGAAALAYANPGLVGPIKVSKGALTRRDLMIEDAGLEHSPEANFRQTFSEELLHLMRGSSPGSVPSRFAPSGAMLTGRKWEKPASYLSPSLEDYYTSSIQERMAGRALGYVERPETGFPSLVLPTEETFTRHFGVTSREFYGLVNSTAYREGTSIPARTLRKAGQQIAEKMTYTPAVYNPRTGVAQTWQPGVLEPSFPRSRR